AAGSCVVTWLVQLFGHAIGTPEDYPLWYRVSNSIWNAGAYLRQMFWPSDLGPYHPFPNHALYQIWPQVLVGLLLVLITVSVCAKGRSYGYLPVGWFWYLGTLVPVIGLVQVGSAGRADRYTYVPLIGLFIILSWGVADLAARWSVEKIAAGVATGLV